ncbi:hypothetical protein [Streptomyces catenulae]|uniref:Uncharacterized protein n=1 Tax=Streptomyces catenulae TaxID=66875 RepID=A0ABV2Z8H4_9ACTN|nr:hypothetical protein [Streptomyces catenulae]
MNHRYVSGAASLASAAALVAVASGAAVAAPQTAARGTSWVPCHAPTGYRHFFDLHSAKKTGGKVVVRVTPETCKVNTANDEDVVYTPSGAARSLGFARGATVTVYEGNTTKKVTPEWLTSHQLGNTPHFAYRVDGKGLITALEEIYHP